MEKQNDSMRERLLARLPQPENLAAYREETASLLAKHEKAIFWDKWTTKVLAFCAVSVFMLANLNPIWFSKLFGAREIPIFDAVAAFLFFLSMAHNLMYEINQSKVGLLKEVKQVQLQILELQASLGKTRENQP
jgi:uncharacterized integral membrane protein